MKENPVWVIKPDDKEAKPLEMELSGIDSINDISNRLPEGVYTTLRTYHRSLVLHFDSHIARLNDSAALTGVRALFNTSVLRSSLRKIIKLLAFEETRIRVILDLKENPGTLYLVFEPLTVIAPEVYYEGVKVATLRKSRDNPKAKKTDFIKTAGDIKKSMPKDIQEVILIDSSGRFLEGLSSNFYCSVEGTIWTADDGVLSGTTRRLVLDIIKEYQIPLRLEGFLYEGLNKLDEAFITSVSRLILPVIEIDGHRIGEGRPGPLSRKFMQLVNIKIDMELEDL